MKYSPINLRQKLAQFNEQWAPKIVAQMNDVQLKLAKIEGEFIWHSHAETDEVFLVLEGSLCIHLRDGRVDLQAGEMFVVPRGVEHKPVAAGECKIMLIEPAGTRNTGDSQGERTAPDDVWI